MLATRSSFVTFEKSKRWTRERIVGMIFWGSVVQRMNTTKEGGSSRVLRRALKAELDILWTSSMM